MQTSGKKACFQFPECSLRSAKAMQTSGNANERKESLLSVSRVQLAFCKGNANERKESLLSISRVQLAFCKVSANRVKGKGKRHIYLHRRRAGGAVRCPAGGCHGREKCLPAGLRRHAACRSAVRNRPFRRLARPVPQGKTACFARPAGRGPQVAGGQRVVR